MLLLRCPYTGVLGSNLESSLSKASTLYCCLNYHSTNSSTTKKDYYKILGLNENANPKDIKRAYFEAAKLHHPDSTPGSTQKDRFCDISEAYEVLGDSRKRIQYDITRRATGRRNDFHQRFHRNIKDWDRHPGSTHRFHYRDRASEVDETPTSRQEYVTFFYCAFVSLFGIYVLISIAY